MIDNIRQFGNNQRIAKPSKSNLSAGSLGPKQRVVMTFYKGTL